MASEGAISFDEYYDLFIHSTLDRRNPWMLVKYYMLTDNTTEFKSVIEEGICSYNQEYKDRVIKVGTMIFNAYLAEREELDLLSSSVGLQGGIYIGIG